MKTFQQAQGDLLIERVPSTVKKSAKLAPLNRDAQGRIVLATSEIKGHTHAIYDPGVIAWSLENGNLMLEVPVASAEKPVLIVGGTDSAHRARMDAGPGRKPFPGEGHLPIVITEPGLYAVIRQREGNEWEGWRSAVD